MKSKNAKNTIIILCLVLLVGFTFFRFKIESNETKLNQQKQEHLQGIRDVVNEVNDKTEEQLSDWETDYIMFNQGKTLYEDYVMTADDMMNVLRDNGVRVDKFNNYDDLYSSFKFAEDRGLKIRYSVPNFNDDLEITRKAIIQLDAIEEANQVAEITLNFDSIYQFLADASFDGESVTVPISSEAYSGDEYSKFEQEYFLDKFSDFISENSNSEIPSGYLYQLYKENIMSVDLSLLEKNHTLAECTRVSDDGSGLETFKVHIDCASFTSCVFAFDEDYDETILEMQRIANKFDIDLQNINK